MKDPLTTSLPQQPTNAPVTQQDKKKAQQEARKRAALQSGLTTSLPKPK